MEGQNLPPFSLFHALVSVISIPHYPPLMLTSTLAFPTSEGEVRSRKERKIVFTFPCRMVRHCKRRFTLESSPCQSLGYCENSLILGRLHANDIQLKTAITGDRYKVQTLRLKADHLMPQCTKICNSKYPALLPNPPVTHTHHQ